MCNSIHALFLRELKTRFGTYRLGYVWALLEPIAHMSVLLLIFGLVMHRALPGISFPVFLINGIVPFMLFNQIALRSLNAIKSNRGLFNYRPVLPIDALFARVLLESCISFLVYLILMLVLYLLGEPIRFSNIPVFMVTWVSLIAFSTGIGLLFMVIGHIFTLAEKIIPILIRPLYFISGVMFPLSIIPIEYHYLLLWNPLLHTFELLRHTVFATYYNPSISLGYLMLCAIISLFLGLVLYKGKEIAILKSS